MKISDIQVGAKFQYKAQDLIIEIYRVCDDTISVTVIGLMDDTSDAILDQFVTSVLREYKPVVLGNQTPKRKPKRKFMQARRSSSVIEVKKISNGHATIVNVDEYWNPIAGTERKVERTSLIKSYTPIAK